MPGQYGFTKVGLDLFDVDLPSGGKVQCRRIDVEDLMGLGIMDVFDQIGGVVQKEHIDRVKKPQDRQKKKLTKAEAAKASADQDAQIMKTLMDPKAFSPLKITIDRVCTRAVVQPPLEEGYYEQTVENGPSKWVQMDAADMDPDKNYPQQMQFIDKMHIFGTVIPDMSSLARFREGSVEAVGNVERLAEAAVQAE